MRGGLKGGRGGKRGSCVAPVAATSASICWCVNPSSSNTGFKNASRCASFGREKVKVTGTLDTRTNTIHVSNIAAGS